MDNTHFEASENPAKLPDGPMDGAKPGPTLETAVIAALNPTIALAPNKVSKSVAAKMVAM